MAKKFTITLQITPRTENSPPDYKICKYSGKEGNRVWIRGDTKDVSHFGDLHHALFNIETALKKQSEEGV